MYERSFRHLVLHLPDGPFNSFLTDDDTKTFCGQCRSRSDHTVHIFVLDYVTVGGKNIGLDRDSNPGPQEYCSCTLPLSYRTTCRLASRYITKYLYPATHTPSKFRIQSQILEKEKHCEMFSRCRSSSQS